MSQAQPMAPSRCGDTSDALPNAQSQTRTREMPPSRPCCVFEAWNAARCEPVSRFVCGRIPACERAQTRRARETTANASETPRPLRETSGRPAIGTRRATSESYGQLPKAASLFQRSRAPGRNPRIDIARTETLACDLPVRVRVHAEARAESRGVVLRQGGSYLASRSGFEGRIRGTHGTNRQPVAFMWTCKMDDTPAGTLF